MSHTNTVATSPVQTTYYSVNTTPRKIKPFSGASKVGGAEVDYPHWCQTVMRIIEDGEMSKRNILLQSLSGVADDAIDMYRDQSCDTIVEILDQIFGSTSDRHDLLAEYSTRYFSCQIRPPLNILHSYTEGCVKWSNKKDY